MNVPIRYIVPSEDFRVEELAPGVRVRQLHPGGMTGPNGETRRDIPGGQTWSEFVKLGSDEDDFVMSVPDIRMPPNQLWPMHWHDCWTVVVILEGKCLIGDWYMTPGDVFVAAPSIEYGPLQPGPMGVRLLEIFGDHALSPGGYALEYRDHPTLQGGDFNFKPHEGINARNQGRSTLPLDGVEGMWKARLSPDWSWNLGDPADPDRGVVRFTELGAGAKIAARTRADWYGALVLSGSADAGGKALLADHMLVAERNAAVPDVTAGKDGARILEFFRTARAL